MLIRIILGPLGKRNRKLKKYHDMGIHDFCSLLDIVRMAEYCKIA